MKELIVPVPRTVSATYIVPVPAPMSTDEARRQASKSVEARLSGPLQAMTTQWLADGAVKVRVEPVGVASPGLPDMPLAGTAEQRRFIARARAFVRFSAAQRASLMGIQEWMARGPAGALAADLGAPVLDPQARQVLAAEDALAALPDTQFEFATPASISGDIGVDLALKPWLRVYHTDYLGMIAVMTEGMHRFGLPEFRIGPASPDLRQELTTLLNGVAFRIWADLLARAQKTPNASGLRKMPRFVYVPAEMDIHRRDLDRADGVPNRGGISTVIGLRFDPARSEDPEEWLTICPPSDWDMSWQDFIANTCHAMFGFEKPRWHYMPEFGAVMDAVAEAKQTLRQARSRFMRGDLPPGGQLMILHGNADTGEFRWAKVESWEDPEYAVVRDTGRELTPGIRPGPPVTITIRYVADWGIWVDGVGVVEGACTERI